MLSGCYAAMTCCIGRCDLSWSVARRHQLERTYVGRTNFWIAPNASWSVALTSADHETRITCMGAPFETTHEEPSAAEPQRLSAQRLTMAIDRVTGLEFPTGKREKTMPTCRCGRKSQSGPYTPCTFRLSFGTWWRSFMP